MIKILSDRWYIQDQIRPSLGRKVRTVVDIATDESTLKIPLIRDIEKHILGIRVHGVNLGRELTFFEEGNYLVVDLGDLKSWTSTPTSEGLTRVRLELQFTIKDPRFKLSSWDLGYMSLFEMDGYRLEKGSITLPPGLKLKKDEIKIALRINHEGKVEVEEDVFNLVADYVTKEGKSKKYIFHPHQEEREILKSEETRFTFKVSYHAVNERLYYVISIIGFALFLVAIFRFYAVLTSDPKLNFDIRFLAASVGFLGLVMGLVREGYELPLRRMIFVAILFLVVDLGLELLLLK